jgi:hypothetical protein
MSLLRNKFNLALIALSLSSNAMAEELLVIFESGQTTPILTGERTVVDADLIQLQLSADWILSATKNTAFLIHHNQPNEPNTYLIHVLSGNITLLNPQHNEVIHVQSGTTLSGPKAEYCLSKSYAPACSFHVYFDSKNETAPSNSSQNKTLEISNNVKLSNVVMVQQKEYLNDIQLNVQDINNVLGSLLNLFVRNKNK